MEDKYVGTQIGIYKILEKSEKDSHGYTKYLVECEVCHQKLLKRIYEIKTHSKQCKHLDYFWEKGTPHRLKTIYKLMKKRCYNPKDKSYKFYGEKGIQICDEWLTNPQSFITWALRNGYEENLSIDRKDSSKNYSPENCQWVLLEDNSRFKSNTNYFYLNGTQYSGKQISKLLNLGCNVINKALHTFGEEKTLLFIWKRYNNPDIKLDYPSQNWLEKYEIIPKKLRKNKKQFQKILKKGEINQMETYTLKSLNEWTYSSNLSLYSGLILTKIPFDLISSLDFAQCKQPTQSASEYYSLHGEDTQPALIVNGGLFYLKKGTPVLTLIDEGKLINEENWLTTGFGIQNQKDIDFIDLKDKDVKNNIRDFCTAYPILVKDGKKVPITYATELKGKNTRTIIGWNTNKTYLCILTFTEKYTFEECQDIILDLGITFAGALDGGTSTQLMIDGVNIYHANGNKESGSRDVDNVFCVYLPNEYPVYKVNLRSFGVKSNCQKLLNEIRTLKTDVHDYSDAYMIYDKTNGKWYYKCRVGYFTVKENAEKLVEDLRKHGHNAFIVIDKAKRKKFNEG